MSHLADLQTEIDALTATRDGLTACLDGLEGVKEDADKFDKGNTAAGVRVRSACLDAKKGMDPARKSCLTTAKAMDTLRKSVTATTNDRK